MKHFSDEDYDSMKEYETNINRHSDDDDEQLRRLIGNE